MTLSVLEESEKKASLTQYCDVRWGWLSSQWKEAAQLQLQFPGMQRCTTYHWVLEESYTCINSFDKSMTIQCSKEFTGQQKENFIALLKCNPLKTMELQLKKKLLAQHKADIWSQD